MSGSQGLALAGTLTVGPVRLAVPALAWSGADDVLPSASTFPLRLRVGPTVPLGERSLELVARDAVLPLRYPVPAPEVSGTSGEMAPAGPETWFVHWPLPESAWTSLGEARPSLVVLGNARTLFAQGEPLIRAMGEIRTRLGPEPAVWLPRVGLPHRLAFLAYLGADLLDVTEGVARAQAGTYLDATLGELPAGDARASGGCDCAFCAGTHDSPDAHVAREFDREWTRVKVAMRAGRLRELVEIRLTAEPALLELLRYTDRWLGPMLEERTPVVGSVRRGYVLRESQRRPEVARFLYRLVERYRPPPSKEILLVVPCSRTKPYRSSPSHRRMLRVLEGRRAAERVHVVSVTSPLGVVPRELEDVYPARHYDIPVTGDWDEWERGVVAAGLDHLTRSHTYREVFLHLDPEEYGFLREGFATRTGARWTAPDGRTLSPGSLDTLRAALDGVLRESTPARGGPLAVVREELREVAAYQFGRAGAEQLFAPPVRLMGRPWFQRLTDERHTDLATWRDERGLFQLTVAGGERLLASGVMQVEVAPEVPLTGDLFSPGVRAADPAIREGDAVLIVRDGRLLGVGEATLPGPLMGRLRRGKAVEVRHHLRGAAPTGRQPDDGEGAPPVGPVV